MSVVVNGIFAFDLTKQVVSFLHSRVSLGCAEAGEHGGKCRVTVLTILRRALPHPVAFCKETVLAADGVRPMATANRSLVLECRESTLTFFLRQSSDQEPTTSSQE